MLIHTLPRVLCFASLLLFGTFTFALDDEQPDQSDSAADNGTQDVVDTETQGERTATDGETGEQDGTSSGNEDESTPCDVANLRLPLLQRLGERLPLLIGEFLLVETVGADLQSVLHPAEHFYFSQQLVEVPLAAHAL